MYENTLIRAGLSKNQAIVYEAFIQHGSDTAGNITKKTPLKRGIVYKTLEELVESMLVEKKEEEGKPTIFIPLHPSKIKERLRKEEDDAKNAQVELQTAMPQMISHYNMAFNKPSVRFFEGKDGIIELYKELLAEGKTIESIEDKGEMVAFIPEYVKRFIKTRIQKGIVNRVISPSGNPINADNKNEFREARSIPLKKYPLSMDIKIVADKVSLITFTKDTAVGILIDHPEIAENFRILFRFMWDTLGKKQADVSASQTLAERMAEDLSSSDKT
jgi:HTH-type transcriptional regulator, sugar sensing transcriptional regulator